MAVYDGFFDAVQDETTGKYDREYETGDFTGYFANIIGSGVCVHNAPDSFKVRLEDGGAVVSPGYLFIQGYWCKNDADYTIELPGAGNYAIVAHLNLGKRLIELEARSVAQAYPDSLVLAIVSPASAEDTRHNTDLCGVIESAGDMSGKVEWAVNYIDNEIDSKLAAVEQDINAQAAKLDKKIAEVQAVADSIVPPPIGSIKFSASQNVSEEWLKCDGSFVTEAEYPELVAALGKLIPSGDKFKLISDGEVGPQISNGVVYGGRLWVYSYSTRKLYGIDLDGAGAVKEITVSGNDEYFNGFHAPSNRQPIALSIVPSKAGNDTRIFLAQTLVTHGSITTTDTEWRDKILIYSAEFSVEESAISLNPAFNELATSPYSAEVDMERCVPYVVSVIESGAEWYYCACGGIVQQWFSYLKWDKDGSTATAAINGVNNSITSVKFQDQRLAYSPKNKGEAVFVSSFAFRATGSTSTYYSTGVKSEENGIFSRDATDAKVEDIKMSETPSPLSVVGYENLLFGISKKNAVAISLTNKTLPHSVEYNIGVPSAARVFVDAAAYLWGKDIYLIFVGTGIIFSRDLEKFGYLDTTSVLGTITQFGYLDYSEDEGTLYILGQDTTNKVKAAKIVLNTLYDYANDGAWLPMIASDGVPAYIKAKEG